MDYGNATSRDEFLHTIGEIDGFIESQHFDNLAIIGHFNVDFSRGGSNAEVLKSFMSDYHLSAVDLSFQQAVEFTYQRDDGSCTSWINHVLCDESTFLCTPGVKRIALGSNLSSLSLAFTFLLQPVVICPLHTTVLRLLGTRLLKIT